MTNYEFIVTYIDNVTLKEKCSRFDRANEALGFISTLQSGSFGNLHCFGFNLDSSYPFDVDKDGYYNTLQESVIEFLSYDLGGFK